MNVRNVELADHWEDEVVERIAWTSADGISEVEIRVRSEVPLSKDGRRLQRDPLNRYYPTMADIDVDQVGLGLLLGDDLRSLAAALIRAADRIEAIDGPPLRVVPGQVEAFPSDEVSHPVSHDTADRAVTSGPERPERRPR